jgi:hypothetical protein
VETCFLEEVGRDRSYVDVAEYDAPENAISETAGVWDGVSFSSATAATNRLSESLRVIAADNSRWTASSHTQCCCLNSKAKRSDFIEPNEIPIPRAGDQESDSYFSPDATYSGLRSPHKLKARTYCAE